MPIYEYRCPNGHTFEVFQRMADAPVEKCQECGAAPVEKVLFPVAVHFKGSGFYSTDYGKGRKAAQPKEGGDASSGSSSSDSGSKESAPAKEAGSGSGEKKAASGD